MADRPQPRRVASRPVVDAELLQRFEALRTGLPAPSPPQSSVLKVLGALRRWVPGTVEWQFRRWCSRRVFHVEP